MEAEPFVSQLAYKFLAKGALGAISQFTWPLPTGSEPGAWVDTGGLQLCERGVHACRAHELSLWLHEELWIVELDGPCVEGVDCLVAQRARLRSSVSAWEQGGAARFAQAARDHAALLVEQAPAAIRPRLVQYVADSSFHLPNGSTALAAFCAAMAVAWLRGVDHFAEEGYREERAWQSRFIAEDLGLVLSNDALTT